MSAMFTTTAKSALLGLLTSVAAGALALGLAAPATASAGGVTYGDPAAAAQWWRLQEYDDCVLMASADVVGQLTGTEPSEEAVIATAHATPSTIHPGPIYTLPSDNGHPGNGTNKWDIPTLLAHYGVEAKATNLDEAESNGTATGIEALKHYLGSGHAVIVSVNAEMIWGEPIEDKDDDGNPASNHSLVVTGVDTANGVVHLNDSGIERGSDEQVSLDLFTKAWATSHDFLVVTTEIVK